MIGSREKRVGGHAVRIAAVIMVLGVLWPCALGGLNMREKCLAQTEPAPVSMLVTKSSFWYEAHDFLEGDIEVIAGETEISNCTLYLDIYSRITTRYDLDRFRTRKRGVLHSRRTLIRNFDIHGANNKVDFSVPIQNLNLRTGVYPVAFRVFSGGKEIASVFDQVVVTDAAEVMPVSLSMIWDTVSKPSYGIESPMPEGELQSICRYNMEQGNEGFLRRFTDHLKEEDIPVSIVFTESSMEELSLLTEEHEDRNGRTGDEEDDEEEMHNFSEDAGIVKESLDELLDRPEIRLIPTPRSFIDMERIRDAGWTEDLRVEIASASKMAKDNDSRVFLPPNFGFDGELADGVLERGFEKVIVNADIIRRCEGSERLLSGMTLGEPLRMRTDSGGEMTLLMVDEQLFRYLNGEESKDDNQQIVQNIVSELFILSREQPNIKRFCVLYFPRSFRPSGERIEEIFNTMKTMPWIELVHIEDADHEIEHASTEISVPRETLEPSAYTYNLSDIRDYTRGFVEMLFDENPLIDRLQAALLKSENTILFAEANRDYALSYNRLIREFINEEIEKIRLEENTRIQFSGSEGHINVVVKNDAGYPIRASVVLRGEDMEFPDGGSRQETINPMENSFDFAVKTTQKGRHKIAISIESNGFVVKSSVMEIATSNLDEILLLALGVLAVLIVAFTGFRFIRSRRSESGKVGKHAKRI